MFRSNPSAREGLIVAAGLLGLIGLQLAAADAGYLLSKNFWLDELYTYSLAADPDQRHAWRALQGAVDTNPPTLHLLLFAYTSATGSTSELAFRSFALLTTTLGLAGIYLILRQGFGVLVSLAATLAVWCHPLILHHAFEVRFYGPWLAAAVWFCYVFGRAGAPGRVRLAALAASSALLCTIHYLGILTLGLIVAAEWAWFRDRRFAPATLAAVATGPIALAIAAAIFLPDQRAAITVQTWVEDPSPAAITNLGITLFLPIHLGAVVLLAGLARLLTGDSGAPGGSAPAAPTPGLIGLASLVLSFPILIAFSYVVQPALISRYAIAAVAGIAPLVAAATARMAKPWLGLLIAFLVMASAYELHERSAAARREDEGSRQLAEAIRNDAAGAPVFFEVPHRLYVLWHYAPDLRGRLFLLDFEGAPLGDNVSRFRILTRDTARQFARFYEAPPVVAWSEAARADAIYLVPDAEAFVEAPPPDRRYPPFTMRPVRGELHRLVRTNGPESTSGD